MFHASSSEKPIIIKRPSKLNVYVNESATFVCRVRSTTPFVLNWTKNGEKALKSVPGSLMVFNETLTLLQAKRADAGIYRCMAKNKAGTSSAEARLTVLGL